ncbi:MAG: ubiquinol-cytochrome c reductase cytochrome c1 subunit [Rhodospirillaceae bacterium]|jgi:ubiquinol-cytochrome c reductase cytochrome c1 subunit|nr:ubiquinol-cytochrome c reductase cytochrome c1 subunit [Rhodospirillaceae bacterium]
MRRLTLALTLAALLGAGSVHTARAAEEIKLPELHWSFNGVFGTFDRGAIKRGFQVHKEICSNCHSMNLLHYRNLADLGFSEDEIRQIAGSVQVTDGPNDNGDMFERPGKASDRFKAPFANPQAARAANNGALPPDLSLIAKARLGGADYIHALMTGYTEPPAGFKLQPGMNYNKYFPGHQIAMPPPLSDGAVTYADGTPATVDQMASDVATFLTWAAEPNLETRHRIGLKSILFLLVLTGMLYAVKRKVWAAVH